MRYFIWVRKHVHKRSHRADPVECVWMDSIFRCGKTTVCQLLAGLQGRDLHSINCHLHTESADFLGGLRPCRTPQDEVSWLGEISGGPLIYLFRLLLLIYIFFVKNVMFVIYLYGNPWYGFLNEKQKSLKLLLITSVTFIYFWEFSHTDLIGKGYISNIQFFSL